MSVELKVPEVGESITEVQIGEWLKKEGDRVERDEVIVMIETDKVTVELPAPVTGVISKITIGQGQSANVGDVIGFMDEGGAASPSPPEPREAREEPPPLSRPLMRSEPPPAMRGNGGRAAPEPPPVPDAPPDSLPPQGFARVMPSARRALSQSGLSAEEVEPTGPGGRLLKEDVQRHLDEKEPEERAAPVSRPPPPMREPGPPPPVVPFEDREEEIVPMTPMRKRIAERLVESQQNAALLTTFNEVDMTSAIALRKQYQEGFQEKYGIKLGFMSFFVKAAIEALKLVPQVNAEIRGTDIVYKNYFDIGVAVGGGRGLVVPIIRNAERLGFAEIELQIADFAKRAQANKLKLDELQGGTFTISNGGIYGSLLSTPIINPPQSGILGLHAIQDRPVAVEGQVVIRKMMYVALTYDHRIVDGREAVTFLKRIKECVEAPSRILLEV